MTQQVIVDEQLSTSQLPEDNVSKVTSDVVDSDARVAVLERNLRYIQEQHQIIVHDLHNEITRLQKENQDLHFRLSNTSSLSSFEEQSKKIDDRSSVTLEKSTNENSLHYEQKIDELQAQLATSEEKNRYLMHKIDELKQTSSHKSEQSNTNNTQMIDNDYQQLLTISNEKQQEHMQEITKLRSVLLEVLNTERLSIAGKMLVRDCLTSTNVNEMSMTKTSTTPIDMLFINEKQQYRHRLSQSPRTNGRSLSFRHELPLRRLNISPPQVPIQRSNSQNRTHEQRENLPSILRESHSPQNQMQKDNLLHLSMSPTNYSFVKIGETPIARRERRTQELQKKRLLNSLYH